jgi:hypothetical protein
VPAPAWARPFIICIPPLALFHACQKEYRTMEALPDHPAAQMTVDLPAWRAERAHTGSCVARVLAKGAPGDFHLWGPAQDSLDAVIDRYRRGDSLTTAAVQECLPSTRLPLTSAEYDHIAAMAGGMAAWLRQRCPVIIQVRPALAGTLLLAGTPLRVRFSARPHPTLWLDDQLVALDHKIGWRLPCPEDLATSPRTSISTRLLERAYRYEPVWVAQWLPHTGAMTIVQSTPADVRLVIVDLAWALAGLRPAPEVVNAYCGTCGRRALCTARREALGAPDEAIIL